MDALIIKPKWLDKIFAGNKTWEIRGSRTHKRGLIGLIQSGSGMIMGEAELVDCIGPMDLATFQKNIQYHQAHTNTLFYKNTYAWILKNAKKYDTPIPYKHPQGAIIWVKI